MLKCPYCYEEIGEETQPCPSCGQFILDARIEAEFPSLDKKKCIYCGKKILQEARVCRYCHQWLDEVDRAVDEIDPEDLV